MRAFQAPWTWNPYQAVTALFLMMLGVGAVWLALLWQREGQDGIRRRIAGFEAELEASASTTALRWNMAFWLVAGVLVFAYFRMES